MNEEILEEAAYRQWLQDMFQATNFLMASAAWEAMNAYLGTLMSKSHGYDVHKAVAALRFLSEAPREQLPGWTMLLWRTRVYIRKRDLDPAILRGLDDPPEAA